LPCSTGEEAEPEKAAQWASWLSWGGPGPGSALSHRDPCCMVALSSAVYAWVSFLHFSQLCAVVTVLPHFTDEETEAL